MYQPADDLSFSTRKQPKNQPKKMAKLSPRHLNSNNEK
jgi:hypothetical protein